MNIRLAGASDIEEFVYHICILRSVSSGFFRYPEKSGFPGNPAGKNQ
jgi:hypothetical protein